MTATSTVTTVIKSTPYLAQMSLNLFWMYITLGRRVSKTRKAFEEQLTRQGMSKEDARRLSLCFEDLKNDITSAVKQGLTNARFK